MNTVLSVIVPVYNAEKYINRCIKSILGQNYKSMEIILVDDGSTDRSGGLCEELAASDSRIYVYHTENKGSVAARNYGVELAKGEVITFVDSDDWIETNMYSYMMNIHDKYKPDIISSGLIYDNTLRGLTIENDLIPEGIYDRSQIRKDIIPIMMYDEGKHRRAVTPSVCTKLIRKDLWKAVSQRSDCKITYGDDASVFYLCLANADKAAFINKAWYHYWVNSNSQVHRFNIYSFEKIKLFMNYMEEAYKELGIWTQMETQLKEYVKDFLYPAIENVYDIKLRDHVYLFPYELVSADSRIVLYGAGSVGRGYMENLEKTNYAKVTAWVDKAYDKYSDLNGEIGNPKLLLGTSYDYVVIAIENEEVAQSIQIDLINMGVAREKIVWKKPERLES